MKNFLFAILALAVAALPATAKVKVRKQQNLSRWHIAPANYSGLTPLGNDRYAVVDDKSATSGFHIFTIRLNPRTGKVEHVSSTPLLGSPDSIAKTDCEDIVFCPHDTTLFIAQEGISTIAQYNMDGTSTGRLLRLPPFFDRGKIQHNASFEALAYDTASQRFFFTTEMPLKGDSLHLIAVSDSPSPILYRMDAPELKLKAKYYAHGISAMTSTPDGKLLVMERELSIPPRYVGGKCRIKVYEIPLHSPSKRLLFTFTTHISRLNYANYEGMCLGPTLEDGRQTLLLINDSQGGVHNGPFRLKDYIKVVILDNPSK
ncbi:MAG: esterase-like activity of phytase family protein [Bacteroidaceae bacterium]|nr:esterase-like activity of phytase family protein [Bacteroidaceae bacterium]